MDIRVRGTRAEIDALLPGLLRGGLQVRNLYDRGDQVAVYLEPVGTPMPSVQFQEAPRMQPQPAPQRAVPSAPMAALPAPSGSESLRDFFRSRGLALPSERRR